MECLWRSLPAEQDTIAVTNRLLRLRRSGRQLILLPVLTFCALRVGSLFYLISVVYGALSYLDVNNSNGRTGSSTTLLFATF